MDAQPLCTESSQHHQGIESTNDSTILQQLSPERINRQAMLPPPTPSSIPSSPTPSLGSPQRAYLFQDPFLSSRRGSDVQAKVAQFNGLSRSNSEKRQELEKALQRARLGREQAENENQMLRVKINEFIEREKKVGLRLEETMEENEKFRSDSQRLRDKYERAKDALAHSKDRFREELRRMKGAEFKADSSQLAAQQALQSERQAVKSLEADLKYSRDKSDRFEKESFTMQIKLVELDEQLAKVQQQMKLVEAERNVLKTSLKEEEVARIAAEGRIPLPVCSTPDEFSSPRKRRESKVPTPKGKRLSRPNFVDAEIDLRRREEELASLARKLEIETLSRRSAEDLVQFMQLECQLKRCSCRLAEEHGVEYVYDEHFYDVIADLQQQYEIVRRGMSNSTQETKEFAAPARSVQTIQNLIDFEDEIEFSPETGTFRMVKSPQKPAPETTLPMSKSEDDVSPDTTVLKALGPAFEAESPSVLALSEATETLEKMSTDSCRVLPSVNAYQISHQLEEEQRPATPKVYQPRQSDADLLSFTPFALPNIVSQDSIIGNAFRPSERFVHNGREFSDPSSRAATQTDSSYYDQQTTAQQKRYQLPSPPPNESFVESSTQHSNSYPLPYPKSSFTSEVPLQPLTASSTSRYHHEHSNPSDTRQTYTVKTITTTTTIPLAAEPSTPSSKPFPQATLTNSVSAPAGLGFSPGTTKSREEALACIRSWRKGNAEAAMASKDTNVKLSSGGSNGSSSTSGSSTTNASLNANGSDNGDVKPRSRSVVLPATPGRRRLVADRDISAPVRL